MPEVQETIDLFKGTLVKAEDVVPKGFNHPVKGAYRARIARLDRFTGESEKCETGVFDFWSLNFQIEEVLEGDKCRGKYLSKTFANTASEKYNNTATKGCEDLVGILFTADILNQCNSERTTPPVTLEEWIAYVEELAPQIVDKMINVRAYIDSKTHAIFLEKVKEDPEYDGKNGQRLKIVDAFKKLKPVVKEETTKEDEKW